MAQFDGQGNLTHRFVYAEKAHSPSWMVTDEETVYRIITDHLGSIRLVLDAETGAIVQQMDYGPFGEVLFDSNPGLQPFGFAGGLYDRDTGLVRFGARDYDLETGRWTAKDPIGFGGGDANVYGYAQSNPLNLKDPTGLWSVSFDAYLGFGGGITIGRDEATGTWFLSGRLGYGAGIGGELDTFDGGPAQDPRSEMAGGSLCLNHDVPPSGFRAGGFVGAGMNWGASNLGYGGAGGRNFDGSGTSYGGQLSADSSLNPMIRDRGFGVGGSAGIEVTGWW